MTSEAIALWTETSSDPELIAGVRAGDSAAFGVLYERHADAARKVAYQYTNSPSDVDDVVSEAFSRVLRALQRGDGPDLAFRAYLFTIVRRTGMDIIDKGIRTKPRDDMSPYESAIGYGPSSDEPALDGFEHGMVADAFKSLPERWQAVLWYTEVEKKNPKEIAPLLGLSANGVAALAYRAREALRQAYLQQHLNSSESADCLEANTQLGAYVRGGLSKREHSRVDIHVRNCERCAALVAELEDVNRGMRGIIAPLFMGVLGAGALDGGMPIGGALGPQGAAAVGASGAGGAGAAGTGAASAGGAAASAGGIAGLIGVVSHLALPAAAVVAATALAISGASIVGWLTPGDGLDRAEGPVAPGASPSSSPSPATEPSSGPSLSPEPSPETSATPSPAPSTEALPIVVDGTSGMDGGSSGELTGRELPGDSDSAGGETGGETGGATGGSGGGNGTGGSGGDSEGPKDPTDPDPTDPTDPTDPRDPTDPTVVPANLRLSAGALDYLEITRSSPQVSMTVSNTGAGSATDLEATIQLPTGLAFASPPGGDSGMALNSAQRIEALLAFAESSVLSNAGWECDVDNDRAIATCVHDDLGPNEDASLTLPLALPEGPLAPGSKTRFHVSGGTHEYSYEVETAIAESEEDLDPIFTGDGGLAVATVGSPLLGCNLESASCRQAMFANSANPTGGNSNNNSFVMENLNRADGETVSATTLLDIPAEAEVVYASLEWSANRAAGDAWTTDLAQARLRAPGTDAYTSITADEVMDGSSPLPDRRHYYQSRADVTDLVAEHGAGSWAVADIATAATRLDNDRTYYAGFALSVVYRHADLPDSRIALFAGREWVSGNSSPEFVFATNVDADVNVDWVTWEADRALSGDTLELDGDPLTPVRWNGVERVTATESLRAAWSANAADSTAHGSDFANSLGVDAKDFDEVGELRPGLHTLTAKSVGDRYLVGSIAVTISYEGADGDDDLGEIIVDD
ncbi:sigma-70 family RNA polymerase sigma factor [Demequina aestuarii]|uniref:sigma-70 family RNA polymerase sigma factor n=1 Tax=Demequina aestuarii TaxID=327095 RepID=UPI000782F925|nr:sigma-70 family RNA polymerase sigma factor [Demequina aestuarii]